MRRIVAFFAFCFIFLAAPSASCAAPDPAITAVQKRYAAMKGMKAEFTQVLTHKESGGKENRAGVLYFAKPLLVRWETKTPVPELLLVMPEAVWNVFPDEDMAYKYPAGLPGESAAIIRLLTGQGDWAAEFDIENKGTEKGMTRILLYPKKPTQSMTEAELLVEAATGRITYVGITDFYYNRNDVTFVSQQFDPDLGGVFSFTPPKGMTVEDRTKSGVESKPLLQ